MHGDVGGAGVRRIALVVPRVRRLRLLDEQHAPAGLAPFGRHAHAAPGARVAYYLEPATKQNQIFYVFNVLSCGNSRIFLVSCLVCCSLGTNRCTNECDLAVRGKLAVVVVVVVVCVCLEQCIFIGKLFVIKRRY